MNRIYKIYGICKIIGGGPTYRSAGACPPRSPDLRENRTPVCSSGSPDPEQIKRKTLSGPVARGPVPRDRPICAKTERQPRLRVCSSGSPDPERRKSRRSCSTEVMSARVPKAWRGTGPRPTDRKTPTREKHLFRSVGPRGDRSRAPA